jgi:aldehyde:ferredoxin oxidoreductase
LVEVKVGKFQGVKVARGGHPGIVIEWGGKCGINNLPAIWKCKEVCEQLGIDEVSACGTVAFAMELFQRGIISTKDTGGLELTWGNEDAVVQMLHNVAFREGFGDTLAEGSKRAAAMIGKETGRYVMAIKGMEMMSCDPRSGPRGWVFGQIVGPRGGDNVKNTHGEADEYPNVYLKVEDLDMFEDVKKRIYSMPLQDLPLVWEGKALMTKWFEDLYSILNALGLCFFPSGFKLAIGPTHISKLLSACTGWEITPEDVMKLGERVFTLLKAYTIRHGLTRRDDTLPNRFYTEPLPEGPARGMVLSKETVDRVLDEYYELRGWDTNSGLPTEQRFAELGLQDIGRQLREQGKIS